MAQIGSFGILPNSVTLHTYLGLSSPCQMLDILTSGLRENMIQ